MAKQARSYQAEFSARDERARELGYSSYGVQRRFTAKLAKNDTFRSIRGDANPSVGDRRKLEAAIYVISGGDVEQLPKWGQLFQWAIANDDESLLKLLRKLYENR